MHCCHIDCQSVPVWRVNWEPFYEGGRKNVENTYDCCHAHLMPFIEFDYIEYQLHPIHTATQEKE